MALCYQLRAIRAAARRCTDSGVLSLMRRSAGRARGTPVDRIRQHELLRRPLRGRAAQPRISPEAPQATLPPRVKNTERYSYQVRRDGWRPVFSPEHAQAGFAAAVRLPSDRLTVRRRWPHWVFGIGGSSVATVFI